MRLFSCLFAGAVFLAASVPSRAEDAPKSGTLLLHYRWRHDTLSLIDSRRIQAIVKKSRSAGRNPPGNPWEAPRTPFSYELVDANGATVAVRFLQDPGIRRVEVQTPGERQLHQETQTLDSADIFLRVPEPEAAAIRFYRHAKVRSGAAEPAAKRTGGSATGAVNGSADSPGIGPRPAPAKTLLAEFPLQ